jgi:quercetin dioxygenase-like cupin family protein
VPLNSPAVNNCRLAFALEFMSRTSAKRDFFLRLTLDFLAENRKLNAYYAEFEAAERSHASHHEHAGVEFLYVISGKLAIKIGEDEKKLAEGDAIYFESAVPHEYRKVGLRRTTALVVVVGAWSAGTKAYEPVAAASASAATGSLAYFSVQNSAFGEKPAAKRYMWG